jgi:signal transduction histidine kinase
MNNETQGRVPESGKTSRSPSIVLKLSGRLVLRLAGIFLFLDLLLLIGAPAVMVVYAEKTAAAVAERLETAAPGADVAWLETAGLTVTRADSLPQGITLPSQLYFLLPDSTKQGSRSFALPVQNNPGGVFGTLDGLSYVVSVATENGVYLIRTDLSFPVRLLKLAFLMLCVFEAIELIKSSAWGRKLIRRTLRPINELAYAAETLNTAGDSLSLEEMESIAYKLDSMNASRLDTRISVDGTQEELKKLAEAINGLLDRISEAYRSQVRFVSDASHELRTPIAVIQGYANLLDRWGKNDPKALQESIDTIKGEASNMKELVEKLLFLARGDTNTLALQLENIDLATLVDEVLKQTRLIDGDHEYTAELSPVLIYADEALMKQALRILIDNAMKYTPAGGHIKLSVTVRQGSACLTVQDDGIGIPSQALPNIFDRFYRADESRARATGGNGLGLSITKWIVERHGGRIEVLSREDLGTRISILLPALEEPKENIS